MGRTTGRGAAVVTTFRVDERLSRGFFFSIVALKLARSFIPGSVGVQLQIDVLGLFPRLAHPGLPRTSRPPWQCWRKGVLGQSSALPVSRCQRTTCCSQTLGMAGGYTSIIPSTCRHPRELGSTDLCFCGRTYWTQEGLDLILSVCKSCPQTLSRMISLSWQWRATSTSSTRNFAFGLPPFSRRTNSNSRRKSTVTERSPPFWH